ncbi:energy transducer TonB [Shewanella sp. KX20019]|uniref:energy transducer TonB n=1 Tax=Shewanella sp. KX20019 TaxID=2803864 RepID=UPI001928BFBB|nr:energy transducer TonB [Shewanella sp. KX20019]QQX79133.1 energy transducer TonB [Shewanella sp. KX20019]
MKSLSIPLILLLSACTATATSSDTQPAQLNYVDLTLKANKEKLANYWIVATTIEPKYPVSAARDGISGCVDLIVGINSEGKLQGYKVRSSYPQGVFDESAAAAIAKWRWSAAKANPEGKPVLTSYQLDFTLDYGKETSSKSRLRKDKFLAHCGKDRV